ncbi:MAG TPA: hypothetical protein VNP04_21465 [Alphaproteobacteria bacterium]|nr:hypothetical protein [Alphaproteobacteria bacterium]
MARKVTRRRPQWPIINYTYRVSPEWGEKRPNDHGWDRTPPAAVLEEARCMQAAWNACVGLWEANRAAYEALRDDDAKIQDLKAQLQEAQAAVTKHSEGLKHERRRLAAEAKAQGKRLRLRDVPRLTVIEADVQRARAQVRELKEALRTLRQHRRAHIQSQAQDLSTQFRRDLYRVAYQEAEGYWAHRMHVQDAFRATVDRFLKGLGQPPTRHEGPIRHIHLEHHFGDGGVPIEQLFRAQSRFAFTPVDEQTVRDASIKQSIRRKAGRGHGIFRMAGTVELPFAITWDRLPPPGSFLKKLRFIGHRRFPAGIHKGHLRREWWDWSLVLTVEVPPESRPAMSAPAGLPTAAIDLNWRLTDQGIRFAVLVDSEGHRQDLYLPEQCSCTLGQARRGRFGRALKARQHDYHQFEPVGVLRYWRWIQARQAGQGAALRQAKEALAELDDLPAGWRRDLAKVGRATLYQWLARCEDPEEGLTADQRRRWGGVLRTWAHHDTELQAEQRALWGRLVRARQTYYRDLAHDLCYRYSTLVLEAMDLRDLARDADDKDPVLREANKYRQLVALSEFRAALKLVAPKLGTQVVWADPAGTTSTCGEPIGPDAICGAPVRQTGEVALTCAQGHSRDQDFNAAGVLLHRYRRHASIAAVQA